MRKGELALVMAVAIFLSILLVCVLLTPDENSKYIYECTDNAGNIIYCNTYYIDKGNAWGILEDGTRISITSYKPIAKEEVK